MSVSIRTPEPIYGCHTDDLEDFEEMPNFGPISFFPNEILYSKGKLIEENYSGKLEKEIEKGKLEMIKEKTLRKRIFFDFFMDPYDDARDKVMRKATKLAGKLNSDKVYYNDLVNVTVNLFYCHKTTPIYTYFKARFYFCKKLNK